MRGFKGIKGRVAEQEGCLLMLRLLGGDLGLRSQDGVPAERARTSRRNHKRMRADIQYAGKNTTGSTATCCANPRQLLSDGNMSAKWEAESRPGMRPTGPAGLATRN